MRIVPSKVVSYGSTILVLVIVLLWLIFQVHVTTVETSDETSMMPTLFRGDTIVYRTVDPSSISRGDIIVFQHVGLNQELIQIVHRVLDSQEINGLYYFVTKGDNSLSNASPDSGELEGGNFFIPESLVLGVVFYQASNYSSLSLIFSESPGLAFAFYLMVGLTFVAVYMLNLHKNLKWRIFSDEQVDIDLQTESLKKHVRVFYARNKGSIFLSVFLIIVLLFLPTMLVPNKAERGLDQLSYTVTPMESFASPSVTDAEGFAFYQITIDLFITYKPLKRIKDITISLQDPDGVEVAFMRWEPLRGTPFGSFSIGLGLIIKERFLPADFDLYSLTISLNTKEMLFLNSGIYAFNTLPVCSFQNANSCDEITSG